MDMVEKIVDKYMFIPKHVDGFELRTRIFYEEEVEDSTRLPLEKVKKALDTGETVIYKGNEYYVDLA